MKVFLKYFLLVTSLMLSVLLTSCKKDTPKGEEEDSVLTFEQLRPQFISFINEDEGWVYASEDNTNKYKLLHSTDGFKHHTIINADMPNLIKITFINANVGFGDTYYDNNYFTLDGGVTWTAFQNPPLENYGWMTYNNNYFMTPIFDYDSSLGHQYVGVSFYNINDGSYSHKVEYNSTAVSTYHGSTGGNIHQSSVHVTDNGIIAFVGMDYDDANFNRHIYTGYSTNTTNLAITEMSGAHIPERLDFPSNNIGFYTQNDDENLYKTINGGQTWSEVYTFTSSEYKELSFISETHGAVLLDGIVHFTNNGGLNFTKYQLDKGNYSYGGIACVDYPVTNVAYAIAGFMDNTGMQTFKLIKITP